MRESIKLTMIKWLYATLSLSLLLTPHGNAADDLTIFHTQVEPLLREHCYECHSHDRGLMEGNLALDWRSGWEIGGDRGPAIVPGNSQASLLIQAIGHEHSELRMPEEKLAESAIAILTRWVEQGAADDRTAVPVADNLQADDWWSLQPLVAPAVPVVGAANPIDAFVQQRLQAAGLTGSAPADRRVLIRRLYHDLCGLPPTYEEMEAFVADPSPTAYEALVDRLLSSPRYGERWARHWFDTIHFAESHGYEHDVGRDHAWMYRDWVINALNSDLVWTDFIRQQLAVDYFHPKATDLTPALGFLGAGTFDLSTYSTATVTFDYLARDDLVDQTMAAFTSTTASCARCHAHKFDPITQEDYYALQAVFSGILKGDLAFDPDPQIARQRAEWQAVLVACDQRDSRVLLDARWSPTIQAWIDRRAATNRWQALQLETFTSSGGATLSQTPEGILVAGGQAPAQDTYTLTGAVPQSALTALRIDLYPHASLPMQGPGRSENGNLHLSEIAVHVFEPGATAGRPIQLRQPTADFNQQDWEIDKAIDGDLETAWGIHPAVGVPHHAVFAFEHPLQLAPQARMVVTLRQQHGRSHLIGAFRISLSDEDPAKIAAVPEVVRDVLSKSAAIRTPDDQLELAQHALRVEAKLALGELPAKAFVYAAAPQVEVPEGNGKYQTRSIAAPKVVHLLQRGDFDKPGKEVRPGALSALTHRPARFELSDPQNEAARRAALADWLAHPNNPLSWRSAVNRVWHFHFGRGICDTPSDFGKMGGEPSHLELLNWLAVWFRDEAGGSLKELHRLIVTSQTYRQSSQHRESSAAIDQDNRLLWRQNRHRLDADAIRDFAQAACGVLDEQMGGPSVQHFLQSKGPQSTPNLDYRSYDWKQAAATRRSIYRYVWRGIADPFMEAVDFPDLGLLAPVRGQSTSALQALALYNNDFILHCSQSLAGRVSRSQGAEPSTVIAVGQCVRQLWLRPPTDEEERLFVAYVADHGLAALCRVLLNSNEFLFVE